MLRMRRIWERERFDVVHVHEPLAPILSAFALASAPCPIVVTCHSAGERLGWYPLGGRLWGILAGSNRLADRRLGVGAPRRAEPHVGAAVRGDPERHFDLPPTFDPGGRNGNVVFIGRNEPRKGLPVLLRAWPEVHRRTGASSGSSAPTRSRSLARAPPGSLTRRGRPARRVHDDELTAELEAASLLVAPSLGGESFGMVLTRAFACATPVVASDIEGYAQVADHGETGILVPPGDPQALGAAARRAPRGRGAAAGVRPGREEGGGAVLLGSDRPAAARDLRAARRSGRGGQGGGMKQGAARIRLPRSRAARLVLVLVPIAALVGLAVWRGPDPGPVERAFRAVEWEWVAVAVLINLFSVVVRAYAWSIVIKQAIPPPVAAPPDVFSAFCIGLLGNAALPGRVGELARVAVVTRHVRRRPGTWATIVGTVFAHRLLDVVAAVVLVLLTLYIAPIPDWASPVLAVASASGSGCSSPGSCSRASTTARSRRSSARSAACCTWRGAASPSCAGPRRR